LTSILLTNFHPFGGGGHSTYIRSLVANPPDSITLDVASPRTSSLYAYARSEGYVCHAVEFPGKLKEIIAILKNLIILRRLLLRNNYSVIHCNGSPDHRLVLLALMSIKNVNRPKIVFTKHNSFKVKNSFFTKWRYRAWTDQIITVCHKQKLDIERILPDITPIKNIANGVCLKHFYSVPPDHKAQLRMELKLPYDQLILVSAAGTALHKGWQYMAEAAKSQSNQLVIVLGNTPSTATLKKIFGNSIPCNLLFPGNQEDVRPYLWAADVGFVLSTNVETISFACREMMACGLPVIVSDTGCLPENVDSDTGWVVPTHSHEAVKKIIQTLPKQDLKKMQQASRLRAERYFDAETFRNQTFTLYRDISTPDLTKGLQR